MHLRQLSNEDTAPEDCRCVTSREYEMFSNAIGFGWTSQQETFVPGGGKGMSIGGDVLPSGSSCIRLQRIF